MKKINLLFLTALALSISGCTVIGGIFKAGFAVGIVVVVVVILLIIWLLSAFRGK